MKIIFLVFFVIVCCYNLFGQVAAPSPYACMGDNTPTLDLEHQGNDKSLTFFICMPDTTLGKVEIVNNRLVVTSADGEILNSQHVKPVYRAMFLSLDSKSEEMTWMSPYAFCFSNPINYIDKDGKKPSEYEAALMAQCVYIKSLTNENLPRDLVKAHWSISQFDTSIIMNKTAWYENGLQSQLFERTLDGKTEYAYVFAGSNSVGDYIEDFVQVFGIAPQFESAIHNARVLSTELGDKELTFVGHSLGGGEAAAASMSTGRDAITFNPSAVSPLTMLTNNLGSASNVTNYRIIPTGLSPIRVGGCFVNNLQENIGLYPPGHTILIPFSIINPFSAHSIDNFVDYFNPKK